MFINNTTSLSYIDVGTAIPTSWDGLMYSSAPRQTTDQKMAGVELIAQYIESYRFRTNSFQRIETAQLNSVHNAAYELDEAAANEGKLEYASETYPSVNSVMQAFIDLNYVKNTGGIGYVRPQTNDIKYFIRQYGGIVLETKLTDQTYNAYDYQIDAVGTVMNEDFTKGFIAFGYDAEALYLQNSLGSAAGSLGFHKMPWAIANQLIIKGAVFKLDNPT